MTAVTLAIGAILVVTGAVAYIATGAVSVTALIPAFVGIALVVAGLIARKPAAHRHAIHAALAIALLGALGSLMNVAKLGDLLAGTAHRPAAIVESTLMFVLLVSYLALGVRSFIRARRAPSASTRTA